MFQSRFGRARHIGLAGVLAVFAAAGCKQSATGKTAGAAPSTSGSTAAAPGGPCKEYAAKVCAKAGEESPTCEAFKTSVELMAPSACTAGMKELAYTEKQIAGMRASCDDLVKTLCDKMGKDSTSCELVTTQTKQFPPERCKMMLQHIPEIVKDLERMEAANRPLTAEQQAAIAAGPAPGFGPEDAKVKIVEFSDFECPFCSRAAAVVHQIREKYGKEVRFVFRQFPLSMHPNANAAAQAALAADAQGKFWELHDALFQNQRALAPAELEKHAQQAGLDMGRFKQAMQSKAHAAAVERDLKLGESVSVQGTPTMFINGKRVDNPTDFAQVARLIDAALEEAKSPG
ncbi:MAG TPA: thioredoxin domain-containing protein [Polyangiaceae bacterium]|nr:thioredoxin domain-containing protein [Polyangiaceae bacterium]